MGTKDAKSSPDETGTLPKKKPTRRERVLSTLVLEGNARGFVSSDEEPVHRADEPDIKWVDIDRIQDNPFQHEEQIDSDAFAGLVASIGSEGLWQAFNVMEDPERPDGWYILTSGMHQRRKAAKAAGHTRVPIFIGPPLDRRRLAFRAAKENATDVNRSMVNQGHLFIQMSEELGVTQEEIAAEIKKSREYVKLRVMAARSSPDIQFLIFEKPDSVRAMTYLRRIKPDIDPEDEKKLSAEERAEKLAKAEEEAALLRSPIIERFRNGDLSTDGLLAEVERVLIWREEQKKRREQQQSSSVQPGESITSTLDPSITSPSTPSKESVSAEDAPLPVSPTVAPAKMTPQRQESPLPTEHAFNADDKDVPQTEQKGTAQPHLTVVSPITASVPIGQNDPLVSERLGQIRAVLSRLQTYKRMVSISSLTEQERQMIGAIGALVEQLLDSD